MGYDACGMKIKNITRFTYRDTSFQGWRVTLCRRQKHFTRYFSDKQYGGEKAALAAAKTLLKRLHEMLKADPEHPEVAFDICRGAKVPGGYPAGLRPCKLSGDEVSHIVKD